MTIDGQIALLQKVTFEVRYRYGFRFLDVCGSLLNKIQKGSKEWMLPSETTPQGSSLVSLANGCFLNFTSYMINLTLEKPAGEGPLSEDDYALFLKQIDVLPEIIIDGLGVTDFTRQGYRATYLFPMDAMEPSERWLLSLGAYSFSESLLSAFGGTVEATSAAITIYGSSARYRIAFEGVERLAQVDFGQGFLNVQARTMHKDQREYLRTQMDIKKRMRQNPEFAVQLDIDCAVDDPKTIEGSRFVRECTAEYQDKLEKSLKKRRA